jgi:prophage regulatory protein
MLAETTLLRLNDVINIVHYSKPSIYRLISEGRFPKPIKLGGRSVFWVESEVMEFVQNCIDESKENAA